MLKIDYAIQNALIRADKAKTPEAIKKIATCLKLFLFLKDNKINIWTIIVPMLGTCFVNEIQTEPLKHFVKAICEVFAESYYIPNCYGQSVEDAYTNSCVTGEQLIYYRDVYEAFCEFEQ